MSEAVAEMAMVVVADVVVVVDIDDVDGSGDGLDDVVKVGEGGGWRWCLMLPNQRVTSAHCIHST